MAEKVSFDPINKIIEVTAVPNNGVIELDIQTDLYSDAKEDWVSNSELIKYKFPIRSVGGDPLPGSKALGRTYFMTPPWRIKPHESSHTFRVNGNLYMEDGSSPYIPVEGAYTVNIESQVSNLVDSTIAQLDEIQYSAFLNAVWLDVDSNNSGIDYPVGTREYPVNNWSDAISISHNRGFDRIGLLSNSILNGSNDISGFEVFGLSQVSTKLTILDSAETNKATFSTLNITGVLDGNSVIRDCVVHDLNYVNGHIHDSSILGTIVLAGSENAFLGDCSIEDISKLPVIDMGGSGQDLTMPGWTGKLIIKNLTGENTANIGIKAGVVIIDPTVTAGVIGVAGTGTYKDNSTGTATIWSNALIDALELDSILSIVNDLTNTNLTQQDIRDAMKLSPSSGTSGDINSVDNIIDRIDKSTQE